MSQELNALSWAAGIIVLASSLPQLLAAISTGWRRASGPVDTPQVVSVAMRGVGNALWVLVGLGSGNSALAMSCGTAALLLAALLWVLVRR